jgi:hypothetical protein
MDALVGSKEEASTDTSYLLEDWKPVIGRRFSSKPRNIGYRNGQGKGKGEQTQHANASQQKNETIVHGCSAQVIDFSLTSDKANYYSHDPSPISPISLWVDQIRARYVSESCHDSPEEIDSFEPYNITWCINISNIFMTKMELVNPAMKYGNTWEVLDEPLVYEANWHPFQQMA